MPGETLTPSPCHPAMEAVTLTLHNGDLWRQFHQHGTEMIITKTGRRMFPHLRLQVGGLNPHARYFLVLELTPASEFRYKFSGGGSRGGSWVAVGAAEPQLPPTARMYVHPDSPATAAHWTGQHVLFNKVKLTNNTLDRSGNIVLNSMHKYVPTVHVIQATDVLALHWSPRATFVFSDTEFMAVTAYQNENVTKLKIDNNPFAKGFRDGGDGLSRSKKRKVEHESKEETRLVLPKKEVIERVTDDSGVSSMGSPTPPTTTTPFTSVPDSFSPPMPMGLMMPELAPYFHTPLWSYPYFLPPPPPPLYPPPFYPYLIPPSLPTPMIEPYEPFLIDLSVKKETVTITNQ